MKLHELLKVISGDVKICIDGREYGNTSTDVELDIKRIDVTTANLKVIWIAMDIVSKLGCSNVFANEETD
jgi:hypothetical protein